MNMCWSSGLKCPFARHVDRRRSHRVELLMIGCTLQALKSKKQRNGWYMKSWRRWALRVNHNNILECSSILSGRLVRGFHYLEIRGDLGFAMIACPCHGDPSIIDQPLECPPATLAVLVNIVFGSYGSNVAILGLHLMRIRRKRTNFSPALDVLLAR